MSSWRIQPTPNTPISFLVILNSGRSPITIADGVLERCEGNYLLLEDTLKEAGNSVEVAEGIVASAKSDSRKQIITMLTP